MKIVLIKQILFNYINLNIKIKYNKKGHHMYNLYTL